MLRVEPPPEADEPAAPLGRRPAWFVALALLGAAATGAVAYALRALLFSA